MILKGSELKEIGIQEYGLISTAEIPFEQEIRKICEDNACRLYAKTWACPPAVGTVKVLPSRAVRCIPWRIPLIMKECCRGIAHSKTCVIDYTSG